MRSQEIEAWARDVIEAVRAGRPCEDSRVELKSKWPEPVRAARRVAAHANAEAGDVVLWLIGVDEKGCAVVGADSTDLATWSAQVEAQFDESVAPSMRSVNISCEDGATVVALLFETDRAPYVVKNPSGGGIQFEVPWRQATATRTAHRSELLRMLVPVTRMPIVEVGDSKLEYVSAPRQQANGSTLRDGWLAKVPLYWIVRVGHSVSIPFHRCSGQVTISGLGDVRFDHVWLQQPYASPFATVTHNEAVLTGPGFLNMVAWSQTPAPSGGITPPVGGVIRARLWVLEADRYISVQAQTLAKLST